MMFRAKWYCRTCKRRFRTMFGVRWHVAVLGQNKPARHVQFEPTRWWARKAGIPRPPRDVDPLEAECCREGSCEQAPADVRDDGHRH